MASDIPREATVYLQVQRHRMYSKATVVRSTNSRPTTRSPETIVVKLRIRIPQEAWNPFEPEAVIDIPAELVSHPIVEVTAEGASDD